MNDTQSAAGEPAAGTGPLAGIRVLDVSLLGPSGLSMHLGDLGADVLKIEPPQGDHIRQVGWPNVGGVSQLHWHLNRGKRSLALNLKSAEDNALLLEIVAEADILVEGMRPGTLSKLGLSWERLKAANPRLVYCAISGYGSQGPYASLATHGLGFDAWAGVAPPRVDAGGVHTIPDQHTSIGFNAGSLYGALGALACVIRARATGQGSRFEVSQAGAAAAFNWSSIEGENAFREGLVDAKTAGIAPGTSGMAESVRYQYYETADGCILFMATERKFWENFCAAIERADLFAANPGTDYDHARGNRALRTELAEIFKSRSTQDWVKLGVSVNIPIAPVNSLKTILDDPHFIQTMPWIAVGDTANRTLGMPVHFPDDPLPAPRPAPALNEGGAEALRDWLGRL